MKFKKIPSEYFVTIIDRLCRFEPACIRYKRVFDDIINKFLLDCPLKNLSFEDEINIVCDIFNSSLKSCGYDNYINNVLISLEEKYFNFNQVSYQYQSIRLNISSMLEEIKDIPSLPKNVKWLKKLNEKRLDLRTLREKYSLLYPIEKIILCEGLTEFTLLETIFSLFDLNFDKLGILILAAGGKNQVAKKYYSMADYVKIPFFILLDKDAIQTASFIQSKLRKKDSLYLLKCGEFEDLIPQNILINAINSAHPNGYNCCAKDFLPDCPMVQNIENIFKKYGFGEFKKAHFAKLLKEYISNNCTRDDFIESEIYKIKNFI